MKGSDNENPTPLEILAGTHAYGMTPELESWWARVFVLFGLFGGVLTTLATIAVLRGLS